MHSKRGNGKDCWGGGRINFIKPFVISLIILVILQIKVYS